MTRRRPRNRSARIARIAAVCLSAAVLTGCAAHDPGTAFSVGDRSVSRDTVATVVRAQCNLLASAGQQQQSQQQSQQEPRAKLTWTIVDAMYQSTLENAFGDKFAVKYDGTQLRQARTQLAAEARGLSKTEADALTKAIVDVVRGQLIAQSVGKAALEKQGSSGATAQQAGTAGVKVIGSWAGKQDVSVNPRYNVGPGEKPGAGDGSVSEPVTSYAKSAAGGSTSAGFLGQLPPGQLCG